MSRPRLMTYIRTAVLVLLTAPITFVGTASAASTSSTVREAQTIMTKFGLPTGPIDGISGPQTARGMCSFRMLTGLTPSRNGLNGDLLDVMRKYNTSYSSLASIKAPTLAGNSTYLIVNQTCQSMVYVENGHYVRFMAVTTGKAGYRTTNGHWSLGHTDSVVVNGTRHPVGWSCSSEYPDTSDGCYSHPGVGRYSKYSATGNMYDKRLLHGGTFIHGSTDIRTYPASHGCIRVSVSDSDWMYDHVGNNGTPYILVTGTPAS